MKRKSQNDKVSRVLKTLPTGYYTGRRLFDAQKGVIAENIRTWTYNLWYDELKNSFKRGNVLRRKNADGVYEYTLA